MGFGTVVAIGVFIAGVTAGQPQRPKAGLKPQQGTLRVGQPAPGFDLTDAEGLNRTRLSELKGKPVVLVFGSCT